MSLKNIHCENFSKKYNNEEIIEFKKAVIIPYTYISNIKGSNIRGRLLKFLCDKYHISKNQQNLIKNLIHKIHNCSLILDDIEDNSKIRRGIECAHIKYGIANSINSTYIVLFDMLHKIENNNIKQLTIKAIHDLCYGQGLDIVNSENYKNISKKLYIKLIKHKTGRLIKLIIDILNELHNISNIEIVQHIFDQFGIFYQIRDDLINITSEKYWEKKGFCSDIYEKKITYPIIVAINNKITNYDKIIDFYNKNDNISDKNVKEIYNIINCSNIYNLIKKELDTIKDNILKNTEFYELFSNIFNYLKY
jgi:geranylgeranyl diphosphate synthase, type III